MNRFSFLHSAGTAFLRTLLLVHGMGLLALAGSLRVQAAAAEAEAARPAVTLVDLAREGVVGTRAPAFKLETLEGETIDLANLYGKKAVYLKFWATWCGPCRRQMPHFENTY